MTTEKKAAPKKTAAKKTTSKKAESTKTETPSTLAPVDTSALPTAGPDPEKAATGMPVATADDSGVPRKGTRSATAIAEEILAPGGTRRWNTGRDRVELLKLAGHDPDAVMAEVSRIRGERRRAEAEG